MNRRGFLGAVTAGLVLPAAGASAEPQGEWTVNSGDVQLYPYERIPPAAADGPSGFPLYSCIDRPQTDRWVSYDEDFHITGWAFDSRDGQQPPFLALLHGDLEHNVYRWVTDYTVRRELLRYDVWAYFRGRGFGNVSTNTGYAIYPTIPLSSGRHSLTVFWGAGSGDPARSTGVFVLVP